MRAFVLTIITFIVIATPGYADTINEPGTCYAVYSNSASNDYEEGEVSSPNLKECCKKKVDKAGGVYQGMFFTDAMKSTVNCPNFKFNLNR